MEADLKDRRNFMRFPVNFGVAFKDAERNLQGKISCLNVSAIGLGVLSHDRLQPYQILDLEIDVPGKESKVATRGEVVWVKKVDTGWEAGIKFQKLDLMGLSGVFNSLIKT